jgi:hypothetical protein
VGECSSISTSSRFTSDSWRGAAWRALRATELEVAAIWDRFVTSACDASDASAGAAETDAQAALRDVLLRLDPQRKRIRIATFGLDAAQTFTSLFAGLACACTDCSAVF